MSEERWFIVGPAGCGILSLSKYGWRGETTTRKASSFRTEALARRAARRQARYEKTFPPVGDDDVVQGAAAAEKLFRDRDQARSGVSP